MVNLWLMVIDDVESIPGCWLCTYPSEKKTMEVGIIVANRWENRTCSKPPTSLEIRNSQQPESLPSLNQT